MILLLRLSEGRSGHSLSVGAYLCLNPTPRQCSLRKVRARKKKSTDGARVQFLLFSRTQRSGPGEGPSPTPSRSPQTARIPYELAQMPGDKVIADSTGKSPIKLQQTMKRIRYGLEAFHRLFGLGPASANSRLR